ncbi:hypothetical protein [Streptomyces sp. NRRL F-4489]|uniref:hypothetical protein n=1 Tax=Streptomyces sp. NRRL F-4489 TaxID=1609095 RepID=UPI001F2D91B3|nr:hypothetical protein [Streptomyces sp. NRRL F-4489]
MEEVQLAMTAGLLEHADAVVADAGAGAGSLRFLSAQLSAALRDAVRVAESRGDRLDRLDRLADCRCSGGEGEEGDVEEAGGGLGEAGGAGERGGEPEEGDGGGGGSRAW